MLEIVNSIVNATGEFFGSIVIILLSLIAAQIVKIFLNKYAAKFAEKTKTEIDDLILKIITKPIYAGIVVTGVYLGIRILIKAPESVFYLDTFYFIAIVLLVANILSKITSLITVRTLKVKKKYQRIPQLMSKIISVVIYIVAILMVLAYFEIDITPIVAGLGIGGLAIGLALQSTLSDFFAGLHILSDKPIRVGDYIELENKLSGFVEDIGWRSTRIRTLPNNIVIIPNSKLANSIVTNYSMPKDEMGVVVRCGVSYNSDLEKVEKVTIDVAKEIQKKVQGAVGDFEPFIRYHTFGDSNIEFSIILRVERPIDKYFVVHEFIKALKKRFDKEGIEISWPVRKIYYGNK